MRQQDKLYELHHLAKLGRLSASLLHEISNPLTTALIQIEKYDNDNLPGIKEARRSIRLLKRYVEAARQQVRREGNQTVFKLQAQLSQVKRIVMPLAKQAGVRLIIKSTNVELRGDPVKFQQIMANLIINAIESYGHDSAFKADRPVIVTISPNRHVLTIQVRDRGQGIAAGNLSRIFEPFFTTKSKTGLGIGLALVKQYVIEDFRGSIVAQSSPHSGTVFKVRLRTVR
jgi:two-component system, NtrC family, C4-dicarboxylate transport sensor histidine kinase DctB